MIAVVGPVILLGSLAMTTSAVRPNRSPTSRPGSTRCGTSTSPRISEERFRAELAKWPTASAEAQEVRTQVARALGLQRKFADAHALLDGIETDMKRLPTHVRVPHICWNAVAPSTRPARRNARCRSSPKRCGRRKPITDEYYAVDAAHMLGIAAPAAERLGWNLKALCARGSRDRSARAGVARVALQQHRLDALRCR